MADGSIRVMISYSIAVVFTSSVDDLCTSGTYIADFTFRVRKTTFSLISMVRRSVSFLSSVDSM